jgi:hypothetical protein
MNDDDDTPPLLTGIDAFSDALRAFIAERSQGYAVIAVIIDEKTSERTMVFNLASKGIAASLMHEAADGMIATEKKKSRFV